jgi:hypothetical protein
MCAGDSKVAPSAEAQSIWIIKDSLHSGLSPLPLAAVISANRFEYKRL